MLSNFAVVVRCIESYQNVRSCSGVVIDFERGLVLTSGSLLSCLIDTNAADRQSLATVDQLAKTLKFEIIVKLENNNRKSSSFMALECQLRSRWYCRQVQEVLDNSMPSHRWSFTIPPEKQWDNMDDGTKAANTNPLAEENHSNQKSDPSVITQFLLLQITDTNKKFLNSDPIEMADRRLLKRGDVVEVISTPFGDSYPLIFYNSSTKGIISNICGKKNQLFLTDARCLAGSEGGAVVCKLAGQSKASLVGVVMSPFCFKDTEWTGFTLVVPIDLILTSLPSKHHPLVHDFMALKLPNSTRSNLTPNSDISFFDKVSSAVVYIQSLSSWGSGVVIDRYKGLIITCSHVVHPCNSNSDDDCNHGESDRKVRVLTTKPIKRWYNAVVLYPKQHCQVLDVAVIKILDFLPSQLSSISLCKSDSAISTGSDILIIGYGMFPPHTYEANEPTVTRGSIASICRINNKPMLIQTSAAIQCGTSGGALISKNTGELLGITVSKVKNVNSGGIYTYISFCIPVTRIYPQIVKYNQSKDISDLKMLSYQNDSAVGQLWLMKATAVGHTSRL
ncbi:Peroxisomal leader peptide-processing protease [Trichoplax sp. H2]|nr:Peroxisomal leader peptide-processing protease [Trichoplax sp. H2]|eukprot:RDD40318.1 Peroxisomal leader peptide-processing protease [Trichoplax sp. H2]